ncbi:uncharacterized protein LOC124846341 [Vigna umbellata]|uniref:uncharacterized protein LOC124846341 n=1 Tax=Vigna umbellata TaxID=87088 RepID=UPI001F5ECF74|nr:uncharacterized protein LOC124846341 [Vigna umbellata]
MGSEMQPFVETPPKVVEPNRYSHRSIETLVVVIAVITIVGVIAGMIARLCGGRHFGGNGENDIEGWVEKKCRSCIDGGLPPPSPPEEPKPAPAQAPAPAGDASK